MGEKNHKNVKSFIPRRDSAKQSPMGSIWYSFHFIVFREGCLRLSIYSRKFALLNLENVLSPEGTLRPNGVHLTVFPFYCVWERVFGPLFSEAVIRLFEILKMFYPPKGLCEAEPNGVHLTVFPFYCVWETVFGPFVSVAVIEDDHLLSTFSV